MYASLRWTRVQLLYHVVNIVCKSSVRDAVDLNVAARTRNTRRVGLGPCRLVSTRRVPCAYGKTVYIRRARCVTMPERRSPGFHRGAADGEPWSAGKLAVLPILLLFLALPSPGAGGGELARYGGPPGRRPDLPAAEPVSSSRVPSGRDPGYHRSRGISREETAVGALSPRRKSGRRRRRDAVDPDDWTARTEEPAGLPGSNSARSLTPVPDHASTASAQPGSDAGTAYARTPGAGALPSSYSPSRSPADDPGARPTTPAGRNASSTAFPDSERPPDSNGTSAARAPPTTAAGDGTPSSTRAAATDAGLRNISAESTSRAAAGGGPTGPSKVNVAGMGARQSSVYTIVSEIRTEPSILIIMPCLVGLALLGLVGAGVRRALHHWRLAHVVELARDPEKLKHDKGYTIENPMVKSRRSYVERQMEKTLQRVNKTDSSNSSSSSSNGSSSSRSRNTNNNRDAKVRMEIATISGRGSLRRPAGPLRRSASERVAPSHQRRWGSACAGSAHAQSGSGCRCCCHCPLCGRTGRPLRNGSVPVETETVTTRL